MKKYADKRKTESDPRKMLETRVGSKDICFDMNKPVTIYF